MCQRGENGCIHDILVFYVGNLLFLKQVPKMGIHLMLNVIKFCKGLGQIWHIRIHFLYLWYLVVVHGLLQVLLRVIRNVYSFN